MSQHQVTVTYDFTSVEVFTDRLDAMIDLLDARLPVTTPPGTLGAPVDDVEQSGGSVEGVGASEPPVGSQVTDTDGDIWERRENGWHLLDPVGSAWDTIQRHGPLRHKPTPPLPVAQDDEVIVKRTDLENALYRNNAPRAEWTRTITNLRAALDRGQGA
ncbi:hypothetical protein ACI3EY_16710 [Ornithinimicrobium sp. LYQ92]|uniref:hypothetical protein n=1 Tax=Serinicoccus sp. LYQ92 TaxID=3378798 RepID=UPI0038551DDC